MDDVVAATIKEAAGDTGVEVTGAAAVETADVKHLQNRRPSNPAAVRLAINRIGKEAASDILHTLSVTVLDGRAYPMHAIARAVKKAGFVSDIPFKKSAKDAGDDPRLHAGRAGVRPDWAGNKTSPPPDLGQGGQPQGVEKDERVRQRQMVEVVFAAFKRTSVVSVSSLTGKSTIRKARIKAAIYNRRRRGDGRGVPGNGAIGRGRIRLLGHVLQWSRVGGGGGAVKTWTGGRRVAAQTASELENVPVRRSRGRISRHV